ncbi:hypothetical protein evm_002109 [Chilo suppressalis]|nr:hypothetical protein evm_002109 [Chilo suppressalis]
MENNNEANNERKFMNKAKSCNSGPSAGLRSKNDAVKHGAVSGTTGDTHASPADLSMKDEHLEKYFRSIEMWRRNYNMDGPSNLHLEIPEN